MDAYHSLLYYMPTSQFDFVINSETGLFEIKSTKIGKTIKIDKSKFYGLENWAILYQNDSKTFVAPPIGCDFIVIELRIDNFPGATLGDKLVGAKCDSKEVFTGLVYLK